MRIILSVHIYPDVIRHLQCGTEQVTAKRRISNSSYSENRLEIRKKLRPHENAIREVSPVSFYRELLLLCFFLWIRSRFIGDSCRIWRFDLVYISILSILRLSVPLCGPEGAFADYAFLIDASSSILPSEFDILKTFVKRVIDFLQIGPNQTHVGVIEYSKGASLQLNFSRSYDKREIKSFVEQVPHTAGITRIDLALKVASEQLYTLQEGMRDGSRKVRLIKQLSINSP